ncbi:MAG: hypothetical protein RMI90_02010 [Thermoguttaceae bacterium]|nr:hypothetical protein [Thermoguttaceae bacterium]
MKIPMVGLMAGLLLSRFAGTLWAQIRPSPTPPPCVPPTVTAPQVDRFRNSGSGVLRAPTGQKVFAASQNRGSNCWPTVVPEGGYPPGLLTPLFIRFYPYAWAVSPDRDAPAQGRDYCSWHRGYSGDLYMWIFISKPRAFSPSVWLPPQKGP